MAGMGFNPTSYVVGLLMRTGMPVAEAEKLGKEFDGRIEECDWVATRDGTTFTKTFSPRRLLKFAVNYQCYDVTRNMGTIPVVKSVVVMAHAAYEARNLAKERYAPREKGFAIVSVCHQE